MHKAKRTTRRQRNARIGKTQRQQKHEQYEQRVEQLFAEAIAATADTLMADAFKFNEHEAPADQDATGVEQPVTEQHWLIPALDEASDLIDRFEYARETNSPYLQTALQLVTIRQQSVLLGYLQALYGHLEVSEQQEQPVSAE